jgi:hypothetical protein
MVHTSEMPELRIWVVTFLAFKAIILGLVDTAISIAGNKVDQNCGCW